MKKYCIVLFIITFINMAQGQKMKANVANPPIATKKNHLMTNHNITRNDEYYWLNQREDKEVLKYLNDENDYLKKVMAPIEKEQQMLFDEMKGRIKENDESVPYKDGNFYYYSKFIEGGEYPIYCRKKDNIETILLNGNEMAKNSKYFNIGGFEVSDNEQIIAFGVDTLSRRNYTLHFKNISTGEILPDKIELTEGGSYAWAADNKTIFYIVRDQQTLLGNKVYKHVLGSDVKNDQLVYEEKDNQYYMGIYRMKSKKYIAIISNHNGVSSEYQILEADKPEDNFKTFLPRKKGLEYFVDYYNNDFLIRTNYNKASNFQLMKVAENSYSNINAWHTIIPNRDDVFLESIEIFKDFLVIQERKNGLIQLNIRNEKTNSSFFVDFGEPTFDANIGVNRDFNTNILRYNYTSMTTPMSVIDFDMITKTKTIKKEQAVLGGFSKNNYITERIEIKARDGAIVPISLVYNKSTKINGKAPLLLYAYGSYGYSTDATFSSARLSLLNRGFVFAIAHIRGGQEMGRKWYDDGKMFNKKNTFNDFEDCSLALISQKYCSPKLLFASGGSAGGLLMGAIINQAPHLYKGIIAAVPFVDVVTTMFDESIPLTTGEFEEWGNPKNTDSFNYMLSYSPYDNVTKKKYPNILVTTGLHDSQVQYWEPAKWVAKMRQNKQDNNILILHTDMTSGHGGASGRFSALKDKALEYAFLLDLANKL